MYVEESRLHTKRQTFNLDEFNCMSHLEHSSLTLCGYLCTAVNEVRQVCPCGEYRRLQNENCKNLSIVTVATVAIKLSIPAMGRTPGARKCYGCREELNVVQRSLCLVGFQRAGKTPRPSDMSLE